jgi:hypothetical protein
MSKFGEELIESMQPEGPGRARDHGGDSRREGDSESFTHVSTPLRRVVPDSTPNAEKLGARETCTRRTSGGLPAGNSAPAKGSHGSRRGLIADFS